MSDELIGKKLEGRYQLLELVGVGGMANVYKGQDLKTGNIVAVKILREEFMQNEELVRRFKNESKAISILDHPNILKVYDVSVTDKIQFIVMEYLDGITLKEYMNRRGGPLTWKETLHFVEQILLALEHAHSKGVVHRDIKPQNVMLLSDGSVKTMDFGIARFSRSSYQNENSDKAIGSVHYISPEQARGEETGATADIYSLGIMLYEMLSGQLPFESDDMVSVAIKQISDKARPLGEIAPDVPPALQEITARAMAKDPADRYPSARAMLTDIEEFKKDPSIRFEYQYLTDAEPERYFNKVVNQKQTQPRPAAKPGRSGKSKKKKKSHFPLLPILAGMAAAFAIGSAILCYMIFANSTNPLFSTAEDVELVNFVGMDRDSIEHNADFRSHFKFKFVEEYSDKPIGQVYSQNPKAPRTVKEGQVVTLKVSLGTRYVVIPDVTNFVLKDAEETLKKQGLSVRVLPMKDDSVPVGTVIRTDPAAGEQVAMGGAGKTVSVYVSRSEVELDRTVPQLVGLTLEDAQKALRNANLVLGRVDEAYSDLEPGYIFAQDPVEGTQIKMNSKVNVSVSIGPEPTPEPEPEPEEEDKHEEKPQPTMLPVEPTPAPSQKPDPGTQPSGPEGEDEKTDGED